MPQQDKKPEWTITIDSFGGFVPAWFEGSYPFYGNKNQAADMKNINIIDPNVLTQGPGVANLTNGTQAGAVTTLIKGILRIAVVNDQTYATGGNKLYQLSSSAVTNAGIWPHTIDKATVTGEDGDDVIYYKSNLYYFYNHSGSAGDIGKYDLATTFDDDWGSTVPSGSEALQSAPHQAIHGGDDDCYFTNGRYIGAIRANGVLEVQALDFWENSQTVSVTWNGNRVAIALNRPNIAGSNFSQSGIYYWNGVSSSWEGDPVEVSGQIGALYTKNGVTFMWWQDGSDSAAYNFGYVSNGQARPIKRFTGSLPLFYQVGEYKGFVSWVSGGYIYLWGGRDVDLPVTLSQYVAGKYATVGGIATPFGELLIASYTGSNYSLGKPSGYTVDSNYKLKPFKVSSVGIVSQMDIIQIETEQLSAGARADFTLTYDKGKSTLALDSIIYSTANTTIHKIMSKGPIVEDFRLDIDFANGSIANPVKIRSIEISGYYIKKN